MISCLSFFSREFIGQRPRPGQQDMSKGVDAVTEENNGEPKIKGCDNIKEGAMF